MYALWLPVACSAGFLENVWSSILLVVWVMHVSTAVCSMKCSHWLPSGSLCNIDPSSYQPISDDSKFYYVPIQKNVNCQRLWSNSIFDEKTKFTNAPQKIPKYLRRYFTHNSSLVDIKPFYFDETTDNIWNETFNNWGKYIIFWQFKLYLAVLSDKVCSIN